jgi:ribosomal-protein-alanine N-acetyltransferase
MVAGVNAKSSIETATSPASLDSAQTDAEDGATEGAADRPTDGATDRPTDGATEVEAERTVDGAADGTDDAGPPLVDTQAARTRIVPHASVARVRRDIRPPSMAIRVVPAYGARMECAVSGRYRVAMTTRPGADPDPTDAIDAETMRRLLLHEARVHAIPGRDLRDLGDAILLHDPTDSEPFWNRLEGLRWPADPGAFDRRLTEILVLFASLGRQPHIWAAPLHDEPADLVPRLVANGFRDLGPGDVMVLTDPLPARTAAAEAMPDGLTIERLAGLDAPAAGEASRAIVEVLLDAFEVDAARLASIEAETAASLGHPWFTHYLVRLDGRPAAVARRATFDGSSYLSSIGTASWARGRGIGSLVTRVASADALAAPSDWVYLGVFAENTGATAVYQRSGFERVGESCPDLVLI